MANNKSHFILGIPNIMTICRILLTPMFIMLLLKDEFVIALLTFTLAGISDSLDGFIARYFNQKTVLGSYLDPFADKLLLLSAFGCLYTLHIIPKWLIWAIVFREILIVIGILILVITNKNYEINPSFLSKFNTVVQVLLVFESLIFLAQPEINTFHKPLCWIALLFTTISGMQYIVIGLEIIKKSHA